MHIKRADREFAIAARGQPVMRVIVSTSNARRRPTTTTGSAGSNLEGYVRLRSFEVTLGASVSTNTCPPGQWLSLVLAILVLSLDNG